MEFAVVLLTTFNPHMQALATFDRPPLAFGVGCFKNVRHEADCHGKT